jgi:hypothetical protein
MTAKCLFYELELVSIINSPIIVVRLEVFAEVVLKNYLPYAVSFLALLFHPEDGSDNSSEPQDDFNKLYNVMFKRSEIYLLLF